MSGTLAMGHAGAALAQAIGAAPLEGLPDMMRRLCGAALDGLIGEAEHERLEAMVIARRSAERPSKAVTVAKIVSRFASRARSRMKPGKPEREKSRMRRRRLGGAAFMPDSMLGAYTEAMRAVLCIVAGEVKRHGVCDLCHDKIAALAGVCNTTVRVALHEARRLGHVTIEERRRRGARNLPNLVKIVFKPWLQWIARASGEALQLAKRIGRVFSGGWPRNGDHHEENKKEKEAWNGRAPPGLWQDG